MRRAAWISMLVVVACGGGDAAIDGGTVDGGPTPGTLTALAPSVGTLTPAFDPAVTSYTLTDLRFWDVELALTATSAPGTAVELGGAELPSGTTSAPIDIATSRTIAIEASGDGATTTYVITVPRLPSPATYLKAIAPDIDDRFGLAVAMTDDLIVIGVPFEDSNATGVGGDPSNDASADSGAVYVYAVDGDDWAPAAYLKAGTTGCDCAFGKTVAVSGDTIVVGAPGDNSVLTGVGTGAGEDSFGLADSGAVHVFVRTGAIWSRQAYIKSPSTAASAEFGASVALDGDVLIVGEPGRATDTGIAYAYHRTGTTWVLEDTLDGAGMAYDQMGISVAVSGERAIVGAPGDDTAFQDAGAAYVFSRLGVVWIREDTLVAGNPGQNDRFGNAVAIAGTAAVVGAEQEQGSAAGVGGFPNDLLNEAGAAYLFRDGAAGWSQAAYLKAPVPVANGYFGTAVAMSEGLIAVGLPTDGANGSGFGTDPTQDGPVASGAVIVYALDGAAVTPLGQLKGASPAALDLMGQAISVVGDRVLVGAIGERSTATGVDGDPTTDLLDKAGAAYLFR
ncbi:MAG: hypothetical protein R2939_22005 [Kofleriaceae bacterium]